MDSSCPDENLVLAHREGALTAVEAGALEAHLSACGRCRHLLVLLDTESASARVASDSPRQIGRYLLRERIGAGGMGEVWRARDPELDRDVAIKIVRHAFGHDLRLHRVLAREARLMAGVTHPNVVRVFDVGRAGEHTFIAMELCDGTNLALADVPPLEQRIAWLLEIADAVAAAHDVGVIHRDLKPQNVLLRRDGRVAVTDFGIAVDGAPPSASAPDRHRDTDSGSRTSIARAGTPVYMAPEQHRGDPVDARADVFAFCVMAFQLVCGRLPFAPGSATALLRAKERGPSATLGDGEAPRHVLAVIRRGLAPWPEDRWSSMRELAAKLRRRPHRVRTTVIGVAAGSLLLVAAASSSSPARTCVESEHLLARWHAVKPELDTRRDSQHAIDRYVTQWSDAWCPAAARTACVEQAQSPLRVLFDAIDDADANLPYRIDAAIHELPPLVPCVEETPWLAGALATARVQTRLGRYDEAIAAIDPLLAQADATKTRGRARLLHERAAIEWTRGDPTAASRFADAAWQAATDERDDVVAATAAALLARIHATAGRPEEAQTWLRHAETSTKRATTPLPGDLDRAALLVHHALGEFDLAEAAGERALASLDDAPARAWDRASARNDLANIAIAQRRLDRARVLLRDGLEDLEAEFGADHPQAAVLHATLGVVQVRRGELARATAELHAADSVLAHTLAPATGMRRTIASNLGTIELARKRWAEGRDALLPLLDGATTPSERAMLLSNIGVAELELGLHTSARSRFEDVLALRRGPDEAPAGVAETLGALGLVDLAERRFDDAVARFEESIRTYDAVGDDNPSVSHPLVGLARVELARGRPHTAIPLLERALSLREQGGFAAHEVDEVRALLREASASPP